MKILITGHKGFVGKAFAERCISDGNEVVGYDLPENDICDIDNFQSKLDGIDTVVHIAAVADLYETAKDVRKNFDVNVRATFEIGLACAEKDIPLIFISTCCVYGNNDDEIETEYNTIPKTTEPYACSKMAAEYMIRGIEGLRYTILRIGTVYGPGMRESLFNYVAIDKILKGETIEIHGTGKQTRNYIHIDDLVSGMCYALKLSKYNGNVYNLCHTEQTSVNDTIDTIVKITGKEAVFENTDDRYGQILHESISNGKAIMDFFPWFPKYKYAEGMAHTILNDKRFKDMI